MNATAYFDKLNNLVSSKQFATRVSTAQQFSDGIRNIFNGMLSDIVSGTFSRQHINGKYDDELFDLYVMLSEDVVDLSNDLLISHEKQFVQQLSDAIYRTYNHAPGGEIFDQAKQEEKPVDEIYIPEQIKNFLGSEHADSIGNNEGTFIANVGELDDAIKQGAQYKTWRTAEDDRVRNTHIDMDGITIPIDETFVVGPSQSRFTIPKDTSFDPAPEEYINCRCFCDYS